MACNRTPQHSSNSTDTQFCFLQCYTSEIPKEPIFLETFASGRPAERLAGRPSLARVATRKRIGYVTFDGPSGKMSFLLSPSHCSKKDLHVTIFFSALFLPLALLLLSSLFYALRELVNTDSMTSCCFCEHPSPNATSMYFPT